MTPLLGQQFDRIADQVGGAAALALCAVAGHKGQVYVPKEAGDDGHLFARVLGKRAFRNLIAAFGGEYIQLPDVLGSIEPLRRIGLVHDLSKTGSGTKTIAAALKCSRQNVARILRDLDGVGPIVATEADNDEPAEVQHAAA